MTFQIETWNETETQDLDITFGPTFENSRSVISYVEEKISEAEKWKIYISEFFEDDDEGDREYPLNYENDWLESMGWERPDIEKV